MAKKKDVNIHYFRVITTADGTAFNLQGAAAVAHRQVSNLEERTIDRGDKRYSCLSCEEHSEGILLNISVCTPGEPTNTIPKPNRQTVVEPSLMIAPEDTDFMDGDAHALIWENHVLICSLRSRPQLLKAYLDAIFSELDVDVPEYHLAPAAPAQALRALGEGIKKIDIFTAAYVAQLSEVNNANRGFFAKIALAAIHAEKPLTDAIRHNNTHVKVTVSVQQSGKLTQNSETQLQLINIASKLVEAEEYTPYCIITKKNSRITPDMLQKKVIVRLTSYGKTVFRKDAWDALLLQKREWQLEGLFDGSD